MTGCPVPESGEHQDSLPAGVGSPGNHPLTYEADASCAWSDYQRDYGVKQGCLSTAHKAFHAGWKAAREGDQSGPLR